MDALRGRIRLFQRLGQGVGRGGHAQHAPAVLDEAAVLDGKKAITTQEQDSSGTVAKIVATTPGAISYLAFSYIKPNVQALTIDGAKPTAANVTTNKWPIWSYEHMYTATKPSASTTRFIAYVQSKAVQRTLVKKLGYISVNDMHVQKGADNKVHPQ